MTDAVSAPSPLEGPTGEQLEVIEARCDARLLVTAGPGAGKTQVLVRRIQHLVVDQGLAPGSEILVLTFSRAAVGELRARLRALGGQASWVRASTFDSFATRILREADPEGRWAAAGYDARILAATELLRNSDDSPSQLSGLRHVFIDELQDVVGIRGAFVLAVLDRANCGWTLFGDPAQGIYNFQLEGEERRLGPSILYDRLRHRYRSSIVERTLTKNFRVQTAEAQAGLWAGAELNGANPDYRSVLHRLRTSLFRLHAAPPHSALSRMDGSVGILGSWNAHALLTSRDLWVHGIDHRVRRSATDRVVPPWVARTLRGARGQSLGQRAFESLFQNAGVLDVDVAEAWSLLHLLAPGPVRSPVDLDLVTRRIAVGDLPDDFSYGDDAHIVVSTIHRSKGLEYDYVFVAAEPERELDETQIGEAARLLYVAMTRARRELFQLPPPDTRRMSTPGGLYEGRWVRWGYKKGHLHAFEIQPNDSDLENPPIDTEDRRTATEVQDYIAEQVKPGDDLTVKLSESRPGCYDLSHGGVRVGRLSDDFSNALGGQLYGKTKNWPLRIDQIRVEGVDTVSGDPAAAQNAGLDGPPLWLRVRAQGLGELVFRAKEAP
ncbi:MAG: ATP-dependent helicase [Chloroflexi bacterium]|nr:ATP-dependent helicase [Chloroflexota bacterium]